LDYCAGEIFIAVPTGIFDSLEEAGADERIILRWILS